MSIAGFSRFFSRHKRFNGLEELDGRNGFGDIVIHPGCQAALAITLGGVSRHGNNRDMAAVLFFDLTNFAGGLETIHFGHLNVHQYDIEGIRVKRFHRLLTVFNQNRLKAVFLKQT